ncbi:LPXTG cell wall anchor domain-containing protein [Weissella viridescens]|uniref:LPXTG cell wall anchor domain-containing protein n=1 Tax=Weissella viridescens TaxID=1629 RepID=A0A3P2RAT2_WEIVI|nr:LPXTG cell wall anchor domain-containing protein [Weissella viridescens]RRG17877.1 LPXTG cell wall anchor domain-containing protein [Weissella viridescens]
MTKKQLLFASAALAAVVATEGTTNAHADDVKASTPATTQVAPAATSTADNTVALDQAAPKTDATATTEAPKTDATATTEAPKTDATATTEAPKTDATATTEAPKTDATATTEAPKADATATTEAPKTVAPKAKVAPKAAAPKAAAPKANVAAKRDDDAMYNKTSDYFENLNNKLADLLEKNPDLNMTDAEYDAFLKTFYEDPINVYNALVDYVNKYGIDDEDFNDLFDDFNDYFDDFEDEFLDDEDDAIEANTGAKNAGSTATKQSNGVVASQAQTRMEKFHGSNAKTLPNTGSDQQNGLAIAGAAMLAGLGALGFGLKKRG